MKTKDDLRPLVEKYRALGGRLRIVRQDGALAEVTFDQQEHDTEEAADFWRENFRPLGAAERAALYELLHEIV